jgi:3-hydroxyisobutyrate dehydrogenase
LLINSLWFTQVVSLTEALRLGQAGGVDPSTLAALLPDSPAASVLIRDYLPRLLQGDHVADFGLDRVVEELDSFSAFANERAGPFGLSHETRAPAPRSPGPLRPDQRRTARCRSARTPRRTATR